jgi:hypothetical protein
MEQVHASSNFTPSGAVALALQTGEKNVKEPRATLTFVFVFVLSMLTITTLIS